MKKALTIKQKLLVVTLGISTIIFSLTIGYISYKAKSAAMDDAISITNAIAAQHTAGLKGMLEHDLTTIQTLAKSVLTYTLMPEEQRKDVFSKAYFEVLKNNPQFSAIWDSWELSHLDPTYTKNYGRYKTEFWREGQQIKSSFSLQSLTGDSPNYARVKQKATDCFENPYFYSYTGSEQDQLLMTSIISPILEDEKFIGVVGADINLERYNPIISQIKPFKGSYAFLISNDLRYASHPDIEKLGQNLLLDYETTLDRFGAIPKIVNGENCSFFAKDSHGKKSYFVFTPLYIGHTNSPWSLAIVVPLATISAKSNLNFAFSFIIGIIGLVILALAMLYTSQYISKPILAITGVIKKMALGNISENMKLSLDNHDEIGQMGNALNQTIDGLTQKVTFATKIGSGQIEYDFTTLSNNDILGTALLDMRENIKVAQEEEKKRRVEDSRRQWTNEGIAKLGEILRQNNDNMDNLSKSIVKELVEMLGANQGGLFLINDDMPDDPHFKLVASYAYSRFKYKQKKILPGEGLIGACSQEKKTIYLTEVPKGYIEITSGLGKSNPNALIIVPLIVDDNVLGVIEMASFNPFEDYQLEFVDRVAETIASTIASVKINIKTASLLAKTQQQAEEMQAQDEEMRQNMEELQATQEESLRKSTEMQGIIDALNNSCFVIEYDTNGCITSINNRFLELVGLDREEVIGTHHAENIDLDPEKKRDYEMFWNDLRSGVIQTQMNRFIVKGKLTLFQETYTPLKNEQGIVYRILKISHIVNQSGSQTKGDDL